MNTAADYIGWAGNDNLGDDACLQAIRRLCAPVEVQQAQSPSAGLCIVGGGTLVYGASFLSIAEKALRRNARIAVLGAGVDLTVAVPRWEPWRRRGWSAVLHNAVSVGVRGPRSLEAVRQLGARDACVIGDPALTLGSQATSAPANKGGDLVLVNAGSDYEPYAGRSRVIEVLGDIIEWLQQRGRNVEYLPLRPIDRTHGGPLIQRFQLRVVPCDLASALDRIRVARFVVSLRLHGAVFAAGFGIPCVSLAYRPKCADFAESVGADCLSTAELQSAALRLAIERLEADHEAVARRLNDRCNELRRLQREMAASVLAQAR